MGVRSVVSVLLVVAGGCASAAFQARNGAELSPVTERAVIVDAGEAAQIAPHGERVGTIDESGADEVAADVPAIAALRGGTHVVATSAGQTTSTWIDPATTTRTCTRADGTHTCETTYLPETTEETSTPYAHYDVYRVDPGHWQDLPEAVRPAAISAARLTPVGADGWGVTVGWFTGIPYPGPAASGTRGKVFPTAYTATTSSQVEGVWIGASREHGSNVLAFDLGAGGGSFSGTAWNTEEHSATVPYTTTYGGASLALRVGKHVDWRYVSLAAGVGIGGALWVGGFPDVKQAPGPSFAFVEPPNDNVADLWFPVWSSLTIKPTCDWGVQGLASYDVRPINVADSAPAFAVGVIWQPASACR